MDLKELLGEELYKQVIEKAGDKHKIAIVSDGNWFPKEKFDEVYNAKKQAETDLKERDKQLSQLQEAAKGNEALQTQIKELQEANKTATE
ncbi:phage scaffolding protein, partial [Paenibacillus sp. FSL R5-0527]|uniref:phage scaffolding protein n=1 Tax=Paenibacillus sp. FSL R5-0527 TaxID=2975321 RepID=UPI0030FCB93C